MSNKNIIIFFYTFSFIFTLKLFILSLLLSIVQSLYFSQLQQQPCRQRGWPQGSHLSHNSLMKRAMCCLSRQGCLRGSIVWTPTDRVLTNPVAAVFGMGQHRSHSATLAASVLTLFRNTKSLILFNKVLSISGGDLHLLSGVVHLRGLIILSSSSSSLSLWVLVESSEDNS